MAKLLDGKIAAAALKEKQQVIVEELKIKGVIPTLSIIRVGEKAEDLSYEKSAVKRCEAVGVAVKVLTLPVNVSQDELLALIDQVNNDDTIHGVLLFRPLPRHIDIDTVRNALSVEKDIDGIGDGALAGVFTGNINGFAPCTAHACMEILNYYGYKLEGKRVTVVGRSLVIGRPIAMMLMDENATVTICHTRTADMSAACRSAEIIIAAAGKAGVVGKDCFSPGQVIIDVGINFDENGKMRGDADFAAAEPIVGAITPVPGGVGAMTTSILAGHVITAARRVLDK